MGYFALFILSLALLVLLIRPFTVLFHELGHAFPALLLTREKVTIYIGSYGDPTKSLNVKIGLLEIWFRFNFFSWRSGLCVPSATDVSINRQIIYTLTGPLASFVLAAVACYFSFSFDLHGSLKLIAVVFLCCSIFDLFVDLIPRATPITLFDGRLTYNDGYSLKQLFQYKRYSKEYELASVFYNQQEYSEAGHLFHEILRKGFRDEHLYRLTIACYVKLKKFEKAKDLIDEMILWREVTSDDYANAGFIYSQLGDHHKALEFYDKSLHKDGDNKLSLNNKGYTLNLLNRYEEAIPFFDKAIEVDQTYAYSYNNRGLSKIKTGRIDEGLGDINQSLQLDNDNSYAYRNLGIYHLDRREFGKALNLFFKSKELDAFTHMIDELINEANAGIDGIHK